MFEIFSLDTATTQKPVILNWATDCIVVENNTPYPLYINWRTSTIPNRISYEKLIPGGMYEVFAAVGNNFGFFLDTQGSSILATGQKCEITLQKDEIIPNFSRATILASVVTPITITDAVTQPVIINTAGASGLTLNIECLASATGGIYITVETSTDGTNYNIIRSYALNTGQSILKTFPTTGQYFRITVINETPPGVSTVNFTYALTDAYSFVEPVWRFRGLANASATINNGVGVVGDTRHGSMIVKKLRVVVTTANPSANLTITLTARPDNQAISISIENTLFFGSGVQEMGSAIPKLLYRRLNTWAYELDVEIPVLLTFRIDITNTSGAPITNVVWGYSGVYEN